jgi:hypothetical protein
MEVGLANDWITWVCYQGDKEKQVNKARLGHSSFQCVDVMHMAL